LGLRHQIALLRLEMSVWSTAPAAWSAPVWRSASAHGAPRRRV